PTSDVTYDDEAGVDADADGDPRPIPRGELGIAGLHGRHHPQPGPPGPLGVVFVGLGIAKVHEEAIAEILRNVPLQALDHCSASTLVGAHDLPQVFGIELAREAGRIHQVAEQHGELTAFGFWDARFGWQRDPLRWLIVLDRRRRLSLD